ncbi:MAG: murein biosynthesis integral membrane protein MurJ [Chloroflexota bacterium]
MQAHSRRLALHSLLIMVGFVGSRILGLVRNIVIAQQFGTGREYEAFLAAIEVPDLVFQVLAGGAVGSAFIPVFASYIARGERREAWHLTNSVMALAAVGTGAVAIVMMLLAGPITALLVPGWGTEDQALTASLMRTMLVTPVLFAVSGFATSVLNSFQRFVATMLAPIFYNLAIIAAAALLPFGIHGVALGVCAGAALHLLVQVPGLIQQGMPFRPGLDFRHDGVRQVGKLMVPRMFGLGVVQINQLVNVVLATFLVAGSLAYLKIAWLMIMTPLVFAMSVSTAAFPALAEQIAQGRREAARDLFVLALRTILFLTVPMAVGLAVLGQPIISLLFERGQFTGESSRLTAYALGFYALGLAGHAVVEIVDRVFYALKDTRTPVLVGACAVAGNIVLGVLLMQTPLDYGGLALANSVAALTEALILLYLARDRLGGVPLTTIATSFGRVILSATIMGAVVYSVGPTLMANLALLGGVAAACVLGALVYGALALALKSPELVQLLNLRRVGP